MMLSKFFRLVLFILFFALVTAGCKEDGTTSNEVARVCYIPFSASTYAAIDRDSFGKKCTDLGDMKLSDELLKGLFDQVKRATPTKSFDDNVVRLSIRMPDGALVYVNQDGEVIRGAEIVKVSAQYIAELDKELYKLQQRIFER